MDTIINITFHNHIHNDFHIDININIDIIDINIDIDIDINIDIDIDIDVDVDIKVQAFLSTSKTTFPPITIHPTHPNDYPTNPTQDDDDDNLSNISNIIFSSFWPEIGTVPSPLVEHRRITAAMVVCDEYEFFLVEMSKAWGLACTNKDDTGIFHTTGRGYLGVVEGWIS